MNTFVASPQSQLDAGDAGEVAEFVASDSFDILFVVLWLFTTHLVALLCVDVQCSSSGSGTLYSHYTSRFCNNVFGMSSCHSRASAAASRVAGIEAQVSDWNYSAH